MKNTGMWVGEEVGDNEGDVLSDETGSMETETDDDGSVEEAVNTAGEERGRTAQMERVMVWSKCPMLSLNQNRGFLFLGTTASQTRDEVCGTQGPRSDVAGDLQGPH
ncbi:hypothetical protein U1Q18_038396 [Sarracenia purpurea var. burkii]